VPVTLARRLRSGGDALTDRRLRYVSSTRLWTLYYRRHTGRRERYPLLGSASRLDELLTEIDQDPICIFWG
jgi:hypothetical protein